jgi:hypothetical protein
MSTKTLIDKIEALPPTQKAEVESFVDGLVNRPELAPGSPLAHIRARRERLLREHGLFDSLPIIRELRETGE